MDPAKTKRVLKLLDGREADRAQALELLVALGDDDLWRAALGKVRHQEIVGRMQVVREDLPLLAAAPDALPEARALRDRSERMWFTAAVDEGAACLTGLRDVHVTAAFGKDPPKPVPSLATLRTCPVERLDLIGVDLEDGSSLAALPRLRAGKWSRVTFRTLPALNALEELTGTVSPEVTALGDGLPALRRLRLQAPGLVELRAIAGAARLEELALDGIAALIDLGPLTAAIDAGAPLREVALVGATGVRDVAPLARARALERVEVDGADLDDLSPLAAAAGLQWVAARNAPRLADLTVLRDLRGLRCLDLRGCRSVRDLSPVAGLGALRVVALAGTGVAPEAVPAALRPYCTWSERPELALLADRPRHPDDARGDA